LELSISDGDERADAQPELSEAHHELPAVGFDGRRPCLASSGKRPVLELAPAGKLA
jgi:hypothetical protein